jgi:hypothetical protein
MKTQIVDGNSKNPILIVAPDEDSTMSFNFAGKKVDFYELYTQLHKLFQNGEKVDV